MHTELIETSCGALRVKSARSFLARARGLLGAPALGADEALLIAPCNSVHTIGMRYAIDVIFLDREGGILRLVERLRPLRFAACWRAHSVLECRAGTIQRAQWELGEQLVPSMRARRTT